MDMVAHVGHLWQILCVRFSPSGVTEGKKNKCLFDVADKSVTDNKDCVCIVLYLNKKKKLNVSIQKERYKRLQR